MIHCLKRDNFAPVKIMKKLVTHMKVQESSNSLTYERVECAMHSSKTLYFTLGCVSLEDLS